MRSIVMQFVAETLVSESGRRRFIPYTMCICLPASRCVISSIDLFTTQFVRVCDIDQSVAVEAKGRVQHSHNTV